MGVVKQRLVLLLFKTNWNYETIVLAGSQTNQAQDQWDNNGAGGGMQKTKKEGFYYMQTVRIVFHPHPPPCNHPTNRIIL